MKLNFCKLTRIEHLILEVYTSLVNVRVVDAFLNDLEPKTMSLFGRVVEGFYLSKAGPKKGCP